MSHKMKSIINYPLEHINLVNLHAKRAQSKFSLLIYTRAGEGKKVEARSLKLRKKGILGT